MIPSNFEYFAPATTEEALQLLALHELHLDLAQLPCGRRGDGWELKSGRARGVCGHRHVATGGSHGQHPTPLKRAAGVEDLQGLAQRCERFAAGNSRLRAEGIELRLDAIFRHHFGLRPFADEGDDYAVGAEW